MFKKLSLAILFTLLIVPAAFASNMFLKIDGIEGESQNDNHKNEIDVLAWSWGSSTSGRATCVQDLSVVKYADLASPDLLMGHVNGVIYPNAKLTVRRALGDRGSLAYIVLDFKNLFVSSVTAGGSGGQDRLTESITLNFEEVTYQYTPQKADGSSGVPVSATIRPDRCK